MPHRDTALSGQLQPGRYDFMRCIGLSYVHGQIICRTISVSGHLCDDPLEPCRLRCRNLYADGEYRVSESVANRAHFYSNSTFKGILYVVGKFTASENFTGSGMIGAGIMRLTGPCRFRGTTRGNRLIAKGRLQLDDVQNQFVDITFSDDSHCRKITATTVTIRRLRRRFIRKMILAPYLDDHGFFSVEDSISADYVDLEYVTANRVSGNDVNIGPGCVINEVFYRDHIYIDETAWVGKYQPL